MDKTVLMLTLDRWTSVVAVRPSHRRPCILRLGMPALSASDRFYVFTLQCRICPLLLQNNIRELYFAGWQGPGAGRQHPGTCDTKA